MPGPGVLGCEIRRPGDGCSARGAIRIPTSDSLELSTLFPLSRNFLDGRFKPALILVIISIITEVAMRTTKILSLSLPPELLREAERLAKKEGRTKCELFREALRRYIQERRWAELRRYGAQQVRKLGIKETEVGHVIEAYRKGH
jgi:CopG family transcriptional regulator/antitoxin EndoAI